MPTQPAAPPDSLADRVSNASTDLTLLCDTLAGLGHDPVFDIDSLAAEDKAGIELNLLAVAQSILAVLHLAGHDVQSALNCLANIVDSLNGETDQ